MRALLSIIPLVFPLLVSMQDAPRTPAEKKAVYLISHLPEVVAADQYMYTHGRDKRHLETFIDGYPTRENNNYLIRVCEFYGMLCQVHFFFYVNAKTFTIRYFDVEEGKSYPLKAWSEKISHKG